MKQPHFAATISLLMALVLACGFCDDTMAEEFKPNYDEEALPAYTLPDPLVGEDGQSITTAAEWNAKRRPEILRLFETHVYGRAPGRSRRSNSRPSRKIVRLSTAKQFARK